MKFYRRDFNVLQFSFKLVYKRVTLLQVFPYFNFFANKKLLLLIYNIYVNHVLLLIYIYI